MLEARLACSAARSCSPLSSPHPSGLVDRRVLATRFLVPQMRDLAGEAVRHVFACAIAVPVHDKGLIAAAAYIELLDSVRCWILHLYPPSRYPCPVWAGGVRDTVVVNITERDIPVNAYRDIRRQKNTPSSGGGINEPRLNIYAMLAHLFGMCLHMQAQQTGEASMSKDKTKVPGAVARAEKLSPEVRSEIAKTAAAARWGTPKATHRGEINIGETRIPCAVLEDGRRVITETGVTTAILGSRSGASKRLKKAHAGVGALMPIFLAPERLKPFISQEMISGPLKPVSYLDGGKTVIGFDATILPIACEIWLRARDAGALQEQQKDKAQRAEILMRGLAHIGIVALVDEATGYQEVRDRKALQAILDKYLAKELAAWAKRFPDEFYKQMFRLKGWAFNPMSVSRPGVVGKYTVDLIYERLAPGLVEELERLNPKTTSGARRSRHHQWLSDDVGHPALAQHLHAVIGFMRACTSWDQFMDMLDRAFPKKGHTIPIMFE